MNRSTLLGMLRQVEGSGQLLYAAPSATVRKEAKHQFDADITRLRNALEEYGATRGPKAGQPDTTEFTVTFRTSGRVKNIQGWKALGAELGVAPSYARTLLSKSKGTHHMLLWDEEAGHGDSATVYRVGWKARRPRCF